ENFQTSYFLLPLTTENKFHFSR
ncbi:putative phosphatidylinositol kinase, partial [Candida albicans P75010]